MSRINEEYYHHNDQMPPSTERVIWSAPWERGTEEIVEYTVYPEDGSEPHPVRVRRRGWAPLSPEVPWHW